MPKGEVVAVSLQGLYDRLAIFVPNFIVAVIVLILGWMIGAALGGLVQKILETLKVDSLANTVGMDKLSERTGKKLSVATFGNWLVKWFFIIATFVAAADILGLAQVGSFLYGQVIPYFGSVIVAVAIMLVGMIAANFMHGVVRHALQASGLRTSDSLALLTKWAILIFTFLAVLSELRVAETFVQDLFRAVVAMLAIAGGIAFGLGGRDHAKKILDSIEDDVTK
ncbi:MAG: hypothetical protein A3C85_02360 [Candidatus Doudnabacteria bacterium RIFCSPHIGHO2_02_FULL_48_21]|uniref:Small-conductance mechanosensitive ion channel n=1 Tax=Candidatus Doudnabacteria bacterium RIFCSPLOWO2_02_FULL_48_13 TaxID=1817845 RepID=A0A1F5QCF6_9BACT|nr:MAG: hypothetical protein A3K05_04560 [Candidatus Doudnabacteria bacterium RIFCSPHIGHO2_01_48_18]OGE79945.1 MAG: hypothetical protein A2668_01920 [Candidatus Doudnabacteria bacterium RIFCSPHIGHO2_01_FULL_48_180]OGE90962.1 MAG: hypothetical protein A3F44_02595 [Candidatus Doudnabacteria bacterium RIFCSPHIGHO2_12_FULL_47_25]OGE93465.1 MAG: hypothetical protein A3C85_02360 [Candidatus Doudnabacteria bacterium RIFCSPHIGHO2_02_FULL_48_21]OGE96300.1 MAG: hypothetical protein A3A83_04760 [Candidatu